MAIITNSTLTLQEMRDEVRFLMSESGTSRIFTNTNVDRAINRGLGNVWRKGVREPEEAYRDTEPNVREYSLPDAELMGGKALVDEVFYEGTALAPIEYSIVTDATTYDTPTSYSVTGNTLVLDPIPNALGELRVRYRREFTKLVNGTDQTTMSDNEVNAGLLYAVHLLKLKDEEFQSAAAYLQAYEDALKLATGTQTGVYKAAEVMYGGAV